MLQYSGRMVTVYHNEVKKEKKLDLALTCQRFYQVGRGQDHKDRLYMEHLNDHMFEDSIFA